ncbi:MAG TPA: hypothetical protein VHN80_32050 [Kineosporiaceae bacterium]|nr:hypothetical protein [Kineosporiaceae bacterium]
MEHHPEQATTIGQALSELGTPLPLRPTLLVLSTLGLVLIGCLVALTRIGYGTARERFRLLASLYEAGALANARELRPAVSVLLVLRSTWAANRLGPSAETARLHSSTAHLAFAAGLPRLGRRLTANATRMAARLGDPRLSANVAWLDAFDRHGFGLDQGQQLERVWAEQQRWLDVGSAVDIHLVLCWDVLLRGDVASAQLVYARRRSLVSGSDQSGRTADHPNEAALLALQGDPNESMTYLTRMRERAELLWERLDVLFATMLIAVELDELGAPSSTTRWTSSTGSQRFGHPHPGGARGLVRPGRPPGHARTRSGTPHRLPPHHQHRGAFLTHLGPPSTRRPRRPRAVDGWRQAAAGGAAAACSGSPRG